MDAIELRLLEACQEVVRRQNELLPLLACALSVPPSGVFYEWAFRRCRQRGKLEGSDWSWFFHGLECDLKNVADGRFLRLDFGPHGRLDTFTAWGVLQFIMTSAPPWREFPELQVVFAEKPPPYDQFAGSLSKLIPVWDRLQEQDAFAFADPTLVDFEARHTSRGSDGLLHVTYPPGTTEEMSVNAKVAHRQCLTPWANQLLDNRQSVSDTHALNI